MDNCYYKCNPQEEIDNIETNKTTYNLPHIELNNEKIIQKIKELMKEKYFYYKPQLIALINLQKEYPMAQIDYALTELITNKTESVINVGGNSESIVESETWKYNISEPYKS